MPFPLTPSGPPLLVNKTRHSRLRLCLYQPDIPGNTGTLLRLCASWHIGMEIIEPCGFLWSDKRLKRAGMDYLDRVHIGFHGSWPDFKNTLGTRHRVILLTRKAEQPYTDFRFHPSDILLLGRETGGVPGDIAAEATARITIPMRADLRALNVALAGAIILGEAMRQTGQWPLDAG